ncbi:MAG: hypothetical protein GXO08_00655 [Aquificae bacterium]|nr:hypothetical protein [Aquificota bacterium]
MRFRKYSRKHAFNILYQWDITGEPLERIAENYWETLERTYGAVAELAAQLREKLQKGEEVDVEVYAKKFEGFADEEILADKVRKKLFAVFTLLKAVEEFHNFALAATEWLSERNKKRLEKALSILKEVRQTLERLAQEDPERADELLQLVEFLRSLEERPPQDFETVKEAEREFRQKVFSVVVRYLEEIEEFSKKRVSEDMGEIKEYARKLLDAYREHKVEVDSLIEEFLKDWTLDSLGSIERNLLRLGTAEFLFVGVQDPGRAFNDYIDFAKAFVGKKAAKFVNGVLSAIYNKKVENRAAEGG